MPASASFDDPALRAAMARFLEVAAQFDETGAVGAEARQLLDLAEAKTLAGLALRKRLSELGWCAPGVIEAVPERQRSTL